MTADQWVQVVWTLAVEPSISHSGWFHWAAWCTTTPSPIPQHYAEGDEPTREDAFDHATRHIDRTEQV